MTRDLSALLRGTWAFHRRLLHASGDVLEVRGRASWTAAAAAAAALDYDERGLMTRSGAPVADVRQTHVWRLRGGGTAADVHFSDGRFFHSVELAPTGSVGGGGGGGGAAPALRCETRHDCAPDVYEGAWAVVPPHAEDGEAGAEALECEWRVSGPAKSYRSTTRFWREADGADARSAGLGLALGAGAGGLASLYGDGAGHPGTAAPQSGGGAVGGGTTGGGGGGGTLEAAGPCAESPFEGIAALPAAAPPLAEVDLPTNAIAAPVDASVPASPSAAPPAGSPAGSPVVSQAASPAAAPLAASAEAAAAPGAAPPYGASPVMSPFSPALAILFAPPLPPPAAAAGPPPQAPPFGLLFDLPQGGVDGAGAGAELLPLAASPADALVLLWALAMMDAWAAVPPPAAEGGGNQGGSAGCHCAHRRPLLAPLDLPPLEEDGVADHMPPPYFGDD